MKITKNELILYALTIVLGGILGYSLKNRPVTTYIDQQINKRMEIVEQNIKKDTLYIKSKNNPREFVSASKTIKYSVVGIISPTVKEISPQELYEQIYKNWGFGSPHIKKYKRVINMGSGIIVDTSGHILTSNHVVKNSEGVIVAFPGGINIPATVTGGDSLSDLSILLLDSVPNNLFKPAKFVKKDSLEVGEFVLAVGNPFLNFFNSADPTITLGVVSALHRNFKFSDGRIYQDMIQTDAAINPGNSGGPLINSKGEVAGINSFIYTGDAEVKGSVGVGFAIPGSRALHIAKELIKHGRRRIGWTGLNITEDSGVVINEVAKGGPGDLAGIKIGDKIISIADRKIEKASDIVGVFLPYFPGDTISIGYERNGKEYKTTLKLVEVPKEQ